MELINIGACLIENVIGFVFARLLLPPKNKSLLPLGAVIAAGTAVKFLLYGVSVPVSYLLSAAIFFVGNLPISGEELGKKAAFAVTAAFLFCISDFIFGNSVALLFGKNFFQLKFEWLIIKPLSLAVFLPFYFILRKVPNNSPRKFYWYFGGTMSGFGVLTAVVTGAFRGSAMAASRENMLAAAVLALIFYGASLIAAGFFAELCKGLYREQKLLLLETNYKYFREQIDIQNENINTLKKFRHDILNYLSDIRGLICANHTEDALKLLEETAGKAEQSASGSVNSGNIFADVVIAAKSAVCAGKNIKFEYKITSLNDLDIEAADISSLLSNLLDNAIEAADKTDEPYVGLDIFAYNAYIVFRAENSALNNAGTDDEGQLKSTKPDGSVHGCGMEIIRETAEKYNGGFSWKSDGERFTATVFVKRKGSEGCASAEKKP